MLNRIQANVHLFAQARLSGILETLNHHLLKDIKYQIIVLLLNKPRWFLTVSLTLHITQILLKPFMVSFLFCTFISFAGLP